jgi:methylmalonyl-CoA/ethylmalonyl-CoA epimerase
MKLTMDKLPIFQKLHHICIVVRDIENAVKYYKSIGVGPWTDFPPMDAYQLDGYDRPAFLKMRYKFANIDNAQLQLCQPGDGDTPQRRFLDTRGEGVFHLGFSVESCDKAEELAANAGLDVLHVLQDGQRRGRGHTRGPGAEYQGRSRHQVLTRIRPIVVKCIKATARYYASA